MCTRAEQRALRAERRRIAAIVDPLVEKRRALEALLLEVSVGLVALFTCWGPCAQCRERAPLSGWPYCEPCKVAIDASGLAGLLYACDSTGTYAGIRP